MLIFLLAAVGLAAVDCPDYVASIESAESAITSNDVDGLYEHLDQVRLGLACGPILDNPILQARMWLARAVLLDAYGDVAGADDALYAAWRSNPASSIGHLPRTLRTRYANVIDRLNQEAAFRLSPMPEPGSVIYVDGIALHVVKGDELEALQHVRTQAGLHIVQVTGDVSSLSAIAARVRNLQADQISEFNIHEADLLTRDRTPLDVSLDMSKPGSRGCGGKK